MTQWLHKQAVSERTKFIADVLVKYGFRFLVEDFGLNRFFSRSWLSSPKLRTKMQSEQFQALAQKIPFVLEELGPTFIKLGQFICSRPDLAPKYVIDALARLQERVKPVDFALLEPIIAKYIPQYKELFSFIDEKPLGAASIAQTHVAKLRDGRQVVMKILKPDVTELIAVDLKIMEHTTDFLARQPELNSIVDVKKTFAVFAHSLRKETEFTVEASNTDMFRKILADTAIARTPVVEWQLTNDHILTMEYIEGYTVEQMLTQCQPAFCKKMARKLLESFLQQVVLHGVFHGDPHAGNLRFTAAGEIVYLDFGIVGRLEAQMLELIVENFLAIARLDVEAAMNIAMEMGQPIRPVNWQSYYEDMAELMFLFQKAHYRKNSFGQILAGMMKISQRHGIRMPDRFLLLGKAVVLAEGNAKKLDPEIDFLAVAKPIFSLFAKRNMSFTVDETTLFWNVLRAKKKLNVFFNDLPLFISGLTRGERQVPLDINGLRVLGEHLDTALHRVAFSLIIASMLLTAALLLQTSAGPVLLMAHYVGLSLLLFALFMAVGLFCVIFRQLWGK